MRRRGCAPTAGGCRGHRSDAAGGWVAAEKGYLRETGNLLFHVALLALLVAVSIGSLLGYRGQVIVKVGDGFANTLTQYDSFSPGRSFDPRSLEPFSFTLDDFRARFQAGGEQSGAARDFEADVTYRTSPEATPERRTVRVNDPMTFGGARVYLLGHGYAPTVVVKDAAGRVVFDDAVVFLPQDGNFTSTGVIKVPDADPQLGFTGVFLPTAARDEVRGGFSAFPDALAPELFLSVWRGDLGSGLRTAAERLPARDDRRWSGWGSRRSSRGRRGRSRTASGR